MAIQIEPVAPSLRTVLLFHPHLRQRHPHEPEQAFQLTNGIFLPVRVERDVKDAFDLPADGFKRANERRQA